jgi:hypothetical protein
VLLVAAFTTPPIVVRLESLLANAPITGLENDGQSWEFFDG